MPLKSPNFAGFGADTITVGTIESQDATSVQINLGDDAGDDFIVDTNKLVVEGDNGNVGIGTAAPGAQLEIHDTTTSSANTGGALRLSANDGAVMGDSHRLGVIEFTGAEDGSNTQTVGARIEALTDAAWTNAENGCALYFYTTDGNASQTNVLKLDSNEKATFSGQILAAAGDCVFGNGQAAAVSVAATAHNVAGKAISITAGTTTAGTTNNIAGGSVTIKGGQGKGSGVGGDIIFQTANAGGSGSSLNALATALTISDDLSSTFVGDVVCTESKSLKFGSNSILADSSGTMTLSNIDALDATTEATIEAAIDTLSNLTTTGTIGTGVWQGTAVASAYLDADTAHLSGSQTFTGTKTLNSFKGTGGATVTNILDEDAMGTNSATALATQQSIKAYADTKGVLAGSSSITTVGTVGTGTWQGTAVASAYLDADTAHLSGSQTFTGTKTLNSFKGTGGATVTNILDEDAMGTNSATALATQQSIKAYADTKSPVAGHSSIVTVGTVGTGTWQGTAVASAYLDADTAHLSGSQTVTGDKTFSGVTTLADTALSEGKGLTMLTPLLPSTDHTSTGVSAQMLAGGAIAAFETVCIHTTTGEVVISDADAIATIPVIGIAPVAISDTNTGTILLQGFIRDDTWNWTIGGMIYASTTAGAMTQTAPSGTGDFVQALGVALTADVVYFNPSLTLVEVA